MTLNAAIAIASLALNGVWFIYAMWNTKFLRTRLNRSEAKLDEVLKLFGYTFDTYSVLIPPKPANWDNAEWVLGTSKVPTQYPYSEPPEYEWVGDAGESLSEELKRQKAHATAWSEAMEKKIINGDPTPVTACDILGHRYPDPTKSSVLCKDVCLRCGYDKADGTSMPTLGSTSSYPALKRSDDKCKHCGHDRIRHFTNPGEAGSSKLYCSAAYNSKQFEVVDARSS